LRINRRCRYYGWLGRGNIRANGHPGGSPFKAIREFGGYIVTNKPYIPNYGDRYRKGEPIPTAMAESAVNQVISKRFVKQQQMKWTKRGAYLLLQVRTHVLNNALRDVFCRWYAGMKTGEESAQRAV
jgi:hypothetical protein